MLSATGRTRLPVHSFCPPPVTPSHHLEVLRQVCQFFTGTCPYCALKHFHCSPSVYHLCIIYLPSITSVGLLKTHIIVSQCSHQPHHAIMKEYVASLIGLYTNNGAVLCVGHYCVDGSRHSPNHELTDKISIAGTSWCVTRCYL